jgi:broad specificity phosphatase PhoE
MPVICLVRHGQASFGGASYDVLSDLGREQAGVVGVELARRRPRDPLVVCGTLDRQRETAELLMAAAGIAGHPLTDARWNEYDFFEVIKRYAPPATVDARNVQSLLDHALAAWIDDTGAHEADGWRAFADGALAALHELPTALLRTGDSVAGAGRDAIVVTSGGVQAAICAALLAAPAAGVVALNRVAVNAAITTLAAGSSGISLLTFNDHAHFAGDRRALLTYR